MVSTTEPAAAVPPPVDPTAPELPPLEVPPPTTTDGKVEGEGNRGDFEIFFEDENNVPSDKQLAYILMMANSYIEGFDKNLVHPYSALSGMRGWKSKMLTTKELAVREIKRRDPTARTNRKNKTVEELLAKFRPLTDPRDIVFITKKEGEFREKMLASLEELEEEKCNKPLKRKHADIEVEQLVEDANAENELVQSNGSMSYIAAEKVIAAVEELARSNDWKVCIAVADAACNPIMVKRQDGAMLGSFDLAVGKAKAAVHYFSSTPSEKGQLNDVGSGSMAILINGVLVGGVGVSGARPAKLDKLATTGANALKSDEI